MLNEDGEFIGICPVCGARALITELPDYEMCRSCGWIGAGLLPDDYSVYQGRKRLTLEQAQENYRKFGCAEAPDDAPSKPVNVTSAAAFALHDELNAPRSRPRQRGRGSHKGRGEG